MNIEDLMGGNVSTAIILGIIGLILVLFLLSYLFFAFVLMGLSKKTKTDKTWLCWIPIAQTIQLPRTGGLPWWWALIMVLAGFVPFIGWIFSVGASIYVWWKVAEAVNKPGWWSLLLFIPIVNIVLISIMAWGK